MKHASIRIKLIFSFVVLTMFMTTLSVTSVIIVNNLNHTNDNLYNHPYIVTNAIKDIELDIRELQIIMNKVIDIEQNENLETNITRVRELESDIDAKIDILNNQYLGDMVDVQNLEEKYNISKSNREQVISYVRNNQYVLAVNFLSNHQPDSKNDIFVTSLVISNFAEDKAVEFREEVESEAYKYMFIVISVATTMVLITVVGVYFLNRDIYPPIRQIIKTIISQRNDEDYYELPIERNDEIGQVATAMNDMFIYLKNTQELRELEYKLEKAKSRELLNITLHSIGEAVLTTDTDGVIDDINPSALKFLDLEREVAIGNNIDEILILQDSRTKERLANGHIIAIEKGRQFQPAMQVSLITRTGIEYNIAPTFSPIKDDSGKIFGVVIIFRDVTKEIERQKEIKFLSEHDVLTKLKNRWSLETKLLSLQDNKIQNVGIIMGDVNGLKITNDAFGHSFGDKLLVDISNILVEATKDVISNVYRWGGDEFVIVLEKVTINDLDHLCNVIKEKSKTGEKTGPVRTNISLGYSMLKSKDENLYRTLIRAEDMMYENKLLEKDSNRSQIVSSLESSLFEKSCETKDHALRVARYAELMGKKLLLSQNELTHVILLAKLHDIGKISIDDAILNKGEKLNEEEWTAVRKHPETGYRIASSLNELTAIADGILNHHENFDGSGYPRGIKGENIPLIARIVAVADAYDVMTSVRPYKNKISKEKAIKELIKSKGKQFDPKLVDLLIEELL